MTPAAGMYSGCGSWRKVSVRLEHSLAEVDPFNVRERRVLHHSLGRLGPKDLVLRISLRRIPVLLRGHGRRYETP